MTLRTIWAVCVCVCVLTVVALSQPKAGTSQPASKPASQPASAPTAAVPPDQAIWLTSYDAAVKQAKATNRVILMDFTGSDWCIWCQRLHKEVFDTPEFKSWASQNVVLLEVDFPRGGNQGAALKEQNEHLSTKYNVEGFPTVLFITCDGTVQGKSGYMPGGPVPWLGRAQEFMTETKATSSPVCPK